MTEELSCNGDRRYRLERRKITRDLQNDFVDRHRPDRRMHSKRRAATPRRNVSVFSGAR